jgi:ribosomal protein L1
MAAIRILGRNVLGPKGRMPNYLNQLVFIET